VLKEGNCTTGMYKHRGVTSNPHRNLPPCDGSIRICLQWENVNSLPSAGKFMLTVSELPRYTLFFHF